MLAKKCSKGSDNTMDLIKDSLINNSIFDLLMSIEEKFDNFFITIFIQYISLKFIITLILLVLLITIYIIRFEIVSNIYSPLIRNKKYLSIKMISEIYYLIDKTLYRLSPAFPKPKEFNINNLSILSLINKTHLFKNVFKPTLLNSFIYLTLIFYYKHNDLLNVYSFILGLKKIDLKLVNSVSTLVLLLVSFLIILLFRASFIQSKAKKKIYDNIYEQIFEQQMTLLLNLNPLLHKSQKNIQQLNKQLDYIVQKYCEDLTKNKYTWRNNNLERKKEFIFNRKLPTFNNFEDFTDEVHTIFDSFEKLNTYNHEEAYLNVNKKVSYESFELGIRIRPSFKHMDYTLNYMLLSRSSLSDEYDKKIKNSVHIQDYLNSYSELKDFEIIHLEDSIKENVTEYHNSLRQNFEKSFYHYILCDQFRNHLENKNKLKVKDWLITK